VRQIGEVQRPRQIPGDPATDFVTLKAEYNDRPQALAAFRRLVRTMPTKQVLVFVHGFNNHFEDAVPLCPSMIPGRKSCPSSSPGRRKAAFLPMITTTRAPVAHAMRWKTACAHSPKILNSVR
jgi:Alpha/beta hydrolase of unknown function (DUF900)